MQRRWKTARRFDSVTLDQWSMPGLVFYNVLTHWRLSFKPCCSWSGRCTSAKSAKYQSVACSTPVAVETPRVLLQNKRPSSCTISVAGSQPSKLNSGLSNSNSWCSSWVYIAVQCVNAACVLGTVPASRGSDELFYIDLFLFSWLLYWLVVIIL